MSKKIYDPFPGKPGSGYPWLRAKALRCFATPYGAITIPKGGDYSVWATLSKLEFSSERSLNLAL